MKINIFILVITLFFGYSYQLNSAVYKSLLEENIDSDIDIDYYILKDFSTHKIEKLCNEDKELYYRLEKIYKKKLYSFIYECLVSIDKQLALEVDKFLKNLLFDESILTVHKYIVGFLSRPLKNIAVQLNLDFYKFNSVNNFEFKFSELFNNYGKIDLDTLSLSIILLFNDDKNYLRFNKLANNKIYFLLEDTTKIYLLEVAVKMHKDEKIIKYLFDKSVKSKEECTAYADKYIDIIRDALKDAVQSYKNFSINKDAIVTYLLSIRKGQSYFDVNNEIDEYCRDIGTIQDFAALYFWLPQDFATINYICNLIEIFNNCSDFYKKIIKFGMLKEYMHVSQIHYTFKHLKTDSCIVM